MNTAGNTVVFVDGENFQKKVKQIFRMHRIKWDDQRYGRLDLVGLLKQVMPDTKVNRINYYIARLHVYEETKEKSESLVALQRALKSNLENQRVNVIMSGDVRMFALEGAEPVFKEKGVDVRLAVDAVSMAADGKLKTAVICSSDSDLQPVVQELRRRKVKVIYLGFQIQPNKGLIFTSNETVLIRKKEIEQFLPKTEARKLKIRRFDDGEAD